MMSTAKILPFPKSHFTGKLEARPAWQWQIEADELRLIHEALENSLLEAHFDTQADEDMAGKLSLRIEELLKEIDA